MCILNGGIFQYIILNNNIFARLYVLVQSAVALFSEYLDRGLCWKTKLLIKIIYPFVSQKSGG